MKLIQLCRLSQIPVAFLVVGCQYQPQPAPTPTAPNVPAAIGTLRLARDNAKATASLAKSKWRQRRLNPGIEKYGQAASANNAAIAQLIAAVGDPAALTSDDLNKLLQAADAKSEAFHDWYDEQTGGRRRNSAQSAAGGFVAIVGILVDLLKLETEWEKMEREKAAEQRKVLRNQLNECEWPEWSAIKASNQ